MSSSLSQVYRDYPGYVCTRYYSATLLLYRITLSVQALEKRDLSIISQFVLEALSLGLDSIESIARVLGLDATDLAYFAAELLAGGLIEQGAPNEEGQQKIALTKQGQKVMADEEQLAALTIRHYSLHFNTLTGTLEPRWPDASRSEAARKHGEYVLPKKADKPSRANIDIDGVRSALNLSGESERDTDLLSVIDIVSSRANYVTGVEVFVLREREGQDERIVALYKGTRQQNLSIQLTQLHAGGETVIPDDAFVFDVASIPMQQFLPSPIAPLARAHMDSSGQIATLQHEEFARTQAMSAIENVEERQAITHRIQVIRNDMATLTRDRSATIQCIQQKVSTPPRPIDGRAYRDAIQEAIDNAATELILVARHMTKLVMDDRLCAALARAVQHSVSVWIGYDARYATRRGDGSRVYLAAFEVRKAIEDFATGEQRQRPPNLHVYEINAVPANIIVSDRSLGLVSNFDLFAFRAFDNGPFAPPQGLIYKDVATIEVIGRTAMELFPRKP